MWENKIGKIDIGYAKYRKIWKEEIKYKKKGEKTDQNNTKDNKIWKMD